MLDIATLPGEVEGGPIRTAVVVDVLRATTTMAAMLDAGAVEIATAESVEEARRLRSDTPGAVLAGERGGVPPEGFDLGNSPLPDAVVEVAGRRVVLTTTNGTAAVRRVAGRSGRVVALSLTNLPAVERWLGAVGGDILIVCSGTDGRRSAEDELAAGLLADRLAVGWSLTDTANRVRRDSLSSVERHGGVAGAVRASGHAERLVALGFGADVAFCGRVGSTDTVPVLDPGQGVFRAG